MWIPDCLFGWLSLYILGFLMDPISRRNYLVFIKKNYLKHQDFFPLVKLM